MYLKLKRGYWYAVWSEPGDNGVCRRTRSASLHDAAGRPLKDVSRKQAEKALRAFQIERMQRKSELQSGILVRTLVMDFLASKRATRRPRTLRSYLYCLTEFEAKYRDIPASHITPANLEHFKLKLVARDLKPATVNTFIRVLKSLWSWAERMGHVSHNPMRHIEQVYEPIDTDRTWVSWEQFEAVILPLVSAQRHRTAFALAIYAGLRPQEVCHVRWKDVDLNHGALHLVNRPTWNTKNSRDRRIPIHPCLRRELMRTEHCSPYVVGVSQSPPDHSALAHRWARYRTLASTAEHPITAPFDELRASFVTEMLRLPGITARDVQQLAGHADIRTTIRHYARHDSDCLDKVRQILEAKF